MFEVGIQPYDPNAFAARDLARQARAREQELLGARRNALSMAPTDPLGAERTLAGAADFEGVKYLQGERQQGETVQRERFDQEQARNAKFWVETGTKLKAAAEAGMDPRAALQQLAPVFAAQGATPQEIQQFDAILGQNGPKVLDAIIGKAKEKMMLVGPGAHVFDPNTERDVFSAPYKPEYIQRDPEKELYATQAGAPAGAMTPQPQSGPAQDQSPLGFQEASNFVIDKLENNARGLTDSNGARVQYGINAASHPQAARDGVTRDEAQGIYKRDYWDAIGADNLPESIRAQAYDAAVVQGPGLAKRWAQESRGDPEAFARLRLQHFNSLAQQNPGKYGRYMKGWANRVQRVADLGGAPSPQGQDAGAVVGAPAPGGLTMLSPARPKPAVAAPSGYRWNPDGTQAFIPGGPADPRVKALKPMPSRQQAAEDDDILAIQAATGINRQLAGQEARINSGQLNLGLAANLESEGRNRVGLSSPNSRNYQSFRATLEKMRNDSLRLNKGVQTEGDAQRAWNELIANIGDEGVVKQRLGEIKVLNERAATYREDLLNLRRARYGLEPLDTSLATRAARPQQRPAARPQQRQQQQAIRTVRTPQEAMKLPPGTRFRTPDGRVKIR